MRILNAFQPERVASHGVTVECADRIRRMWESGIPISEITDFVFPSMKPFADRSRKVAEILIDCGCSHGEPETEEIQHDCFYG